MYMYVDYIEDRQIDFYQILYSWKVSLDKNFAKSSYLCIAEPFGGQCDKTSMLSLIQDEVISWRNFDVYSIYM